MILLLAAAVVYSSGLGRTLGASEAYSALAASQPTVDLVARKAMTLDPGKPVLYHLVLHYFSACFGPGEASLRAMSVIFGLSSVALLYLLADELFGPVVALAAALIWAFNPLAVLFADWARMYSMFIALTLAHLLFMAKLRRNPSTGHSVICGLLGAAMLYTHLGGVLILAAESAMIVRDFWVRGKSNSWPAVVIAIALFSPFIPVAVTQSQSLLFDHWLDWIGAQRPQLSFGVKATLVLAIATAGLWFVFASRSSEERSEALRWCMAVALMPILLMVGASVLVRPMFQVRYLAPCWALSAVAIAFAVDAMGTRLRRLGVLAITGLFVALIPFYQNAGTDPWRDIARQVDTSAAPTEAVVFEAGFFGPDHTIGGPASGFPDGYYRVPFDFYFHAANPRTAVPASDPRAARRQISDELDKAGGVWLISGKKLSEAMNEVPGPAQARLASVSTYEDVLLLHLKPVVVTQTASIRNVSAELKAGVAQGAASSKICALRPLYSINPDCVDEHPEQVSSDPALEALNG
jgi:hypothetical protein